MKRLFLMLTSLALLSLSVGAWSASPVTKHDDPLVKELEGRYAKFSDAVRRGDLKSFRSLQTAAANAGIPPGATGEQLKQMADMMVPNLSGFKFIQLETAKHKARMAYKHLDKQGMSILVLLFEKDGADWKVGANHSQDYIGQTPKEEAALKEALSSPDVQLE